MTPAPARRLNVGCGHDIREGWVNLDLAALPGVDVVHNLDAFPWPFDDGAFDEIEMINVLEHLPDPIAAVEELYRISAPDARVTIRVPYYNAPDAYTDPTHKAFFTERSFDFFDPTTRAGKERAYYSRARFKIERMFFYTRVIPGLPYLRITLPVIKQVMVALAHRIGGVIWVEEVNLRALKPWPREG
ncbi:MAG TPA: methyltransferase domain-containing protein [Longimicrobium sp.]|nr:methyltransferase domain-containing protein [Longimicrobium sp.]